MAIISIADTGGLVRATLGSAVAGAAIFELFWLPAEYSIDPTGLGRGLGLTQMGEIKQQLFAEAKSTMPPLLPQHWLRPRQRLAKQPWHHGLTG